MGEPLRHIPVKLVAGLISAKPSGFTAARPFLERKFGRIDNESRTLAFSCTSYYEKEFGRDLKRKFFSFEKLARLNGNHRVKLYTNSIEKKLSGKDSRTVNIDPGYVSLAKMVLFTTKNRSHRIYIDKGIYADLALQFENRSFRALPWTYPDYRSADYIDFFNSVRSAYAEQVKNYRLRKNHAH